jgi:tRNA A37 threonylcarbamoyladenosine dehydratase
MAKIKIASAIMKNINPLLRRVRRRLRLRRMFLVGKFRFGNVFTPANFSRLQKKYF